MICPNCGKENENTNTRCESCFAFLKEDSVGIISFDENVDLSSPETQEIIKKAGCLANAISFIFFLPVLLVAIIFVGVGIYNYISERKETKGYEKTTATFKEKINCEYENDTELCEAIYEYSINDKTYTVVPKALSDNFKETETVYYNPKNPSESVIYAGWNTLTFVGIAIIGIFVLSCIFRKNRIIKIKK